MRKIPDKTINFRFPKNIAILTIASLGMVACSSADYASKQTDNFYNNFVKVANTPNEATLQKSLQQAGPAKFYGQDYWAGKSFQLEQIRPTNGQVLVANPTGGNGNPFVPVGYAEPKGAVGSTAGGPFGSLYGYNDNPTGVNIAFANEGRGPAARALQPRILQGSQYALAGPVISSSFNAVLQTEYERTAQLFVDKYRSDITGRYFRNKAMYAQQGRAVLPDDPDLWELTPENRRELWRARYALLQALEFGGRDLAPEQAAFTQVNYDCWLAESENVPQDIMQHPCAQNFVWAFQDMRKIVAQRRQPDTLPANLYPQYAYLEQVLPPAAPPPGVGYPPAYQAPARTVIYNDNGQGGNGGQNGLVPNNNPNNNFVPNASARTQNGQADTFMELADNNPINKTGGKNGTEFTDGKNFQVYFDLGTAKLSPKAKAVLEQILLVARNAHEVMVRADGYADRSGSASGNYKLSQNRVNSVVDFLVANGIKRQVIKAVAHGERDLPHPTRDGVQDARNRVVIVMVKQ